MQIGVGLGSWEQGGGGVEGCRDGARSLLGGQGWTDTRQTRLLPDRLGRHALFSGYTIAFLRMRVHMRTRVPGPLRHVLFTFSCLHVCGCLVAEKRPLARTAMPATADASGIASVADGCLALWGVEDTVSWASHGYGFFFRRDLGSMRMNWQISLADVRRS